MKMNLEKRKTLVNEGRTSVQKGAIQSFTSLEELAWHIKYFSVFKFALYRIAQQKNQMQL